MTARPPGRPVHADSTRCEWTVPGRGAPARDEAEDEPEDHDEIEDRRCGAASTAVVRVVGAGVRVELAVCAAHARALARLPNVVRGPGDLLLMRWS